MPRPSNPEVRLRLLAQGGEIIHRIGYNAAGVQDIVAAAGVPKGSFYNYFETKEAFVIEVLNSYWEDIEARHANLLADSTVRPLKRIENFFARLTDDHAARNFQDGCLIGNLSLELSFSSNGARHTLKNILARWEGLIASCLLEAHQRKSAYSDTVAAERASIIVEAWEGAILRCKIERSRSACDRFLGVTLKHLLA